MAPKVWQIGTGDAGRPYHEWFFEHDVVALGPGSGGKWPRDDYEFAPPVRWFADGVDEGQLVIARRGLSIALGLGVLGPYDFEDGIDIEGWDLSHYRRVRWVTREVHCFDLPVFTRYRFSRCRNRTVIDWLEREISGIDLSQPDWELLPPLPDLEPELDQRRLTHGVKAALARAGDWARYTHDEEGFGCSPSEAEVLCHLTVPLLVALGWPIEQIAIEWQRKDVAVFTEMARTPGTCRLIVEGKTLGTGLHSAREQANEYAQQLGHPVDVVVTDGPRMLLYRHDQPDKELYLNCSNLRESGRTLLEALRPDSR